jgi:tetratricopeptide (TPR) repeat protein
MRYFIYLFSLLTFNYTFIGAQQISLKKPLSDGDYQYLKELAKSCFQYSTDYNFKIDFFDFYDTKIKPEKPSSLKQIKYLENKLKGDFQDAYTYNSIGVIYQKLFMNEEAVKYYNKALEPAKDFVKNYPDSSSAFKILATTYANLQDYNEAISLLKKAYLLNNNDSLVMVYIPDFYRIMGNFDSCLTEIDKFINDHPDRLLNYISLFLCKAEEISYTLSKTDKKDIERILGNKSPEEILDITKIKRAFEKHNNDIQFELLYRFSRHFIITIKSAIRTSADTSYSRQNLKCIIDESDISELNSLEKFYLNCLNDKRIPYQYIINKALANIYMVKGEIPSAVPYLKKAIELKPLKNSTVSYNAAGDYDNLKTAFFLMDDTISFVKIAKQKIRIRPAINPLPEDYITMSAISFLKNKYDDGIRYSEKALKINPRQKEAFIYFSVIDIINGNFKEASQHLDKLYKIDPNNYSFYFLEGICQLTENNFYSAYYSFLIAMRLSKDQSMIENKIINKYYIDRK